MELAAINIIKRMIVVEQALYIFKYIPPLELHYITKHSLNQNSNCYLI